MTSVDTRTGEILPSLAECEQVIERGLGTFLEVGGALLSIRDQRLYKEQHATFEDYCRTRWGFSRQRAHQLIAAAEVSTIVDVQNEGQARELAGLDAETAQVVYGIAAAFALLLRDADTPTAAELKTARIHVTTGSGERRAPATREEAEALTQAILTAAAEARHGGDKPPPPANPSPVRPVQDRDPAPLPASHAPGDDSDLDDQIEDATADERFLVSLAAAVQSAAGLPLLSAERVVEVLTALADDDSRYSLLSTLDQIEAWGATVKAGLGINVTKMRRAR